VLISDVLPAASKVLAVCAHPDDESFGLGAVLHRFVAAGAEVSLLCFTHGEASTLGLSAGTLGQIRHQELTRAAAILGIGTVRLLDHPDGGLSQVPLERLAGEVAEMAETVGADLLLVFDEGGVTGHPDHCQATQAALIGAPSLPALAWSLPRRVAKTLNREHHTSFAGRDEDQIHITVTVDRDLQRRAIAQHTSQSSDNPVLWRRLELLGDREVLHWLRPPSAAGSSVPENGSNLDPAGPHEASGSAGEQWDRRYRTAPRLFRSAPDQTLIELVSGLASGRALDLGAGEGRNSLWLARAGWQVVAVDASAVALARLAEDAAVSHLVVTTVVADLFSYLEAARRDRESFDLVVIAFVHPPPDQRTTLIKAATQAVSPGGHLFVVGHHSTSLGLAGPPQRDRLYTEDELRSAAGSDLELLRLERRTGVSDIAEPGVDVYLWARRSQASGFPSATRRSI
jgi:LmbE family N-acetylglucosaminyl deacetylase/SAM-dependent methyltransferase